MQEEIISTPNHLQLISANIQNFAGINLTEDTKIVLAFPERIIGIEADQGTGKTSLLKCLETLMGGTPPDNATNSNSDTIKAEQSFIAEDGETYHVNMTKSGFTLSKKMMVGGKEKKVPLPAPKQTLQDLIGPPASNPMSLKEMSGTEQIAWIRKLGNYTEVQEKFEKDVLGKKKDAYDDRKAINKTIEERGQDLKRTEYYRWDEENKTFVATDLNIADAKSIAGIVDKKKELDIKYNEALSKNNQYEQAKARMQTLNTERENTVNTLIGIEKQIQELKMQLMQKETDLAATDKNIEKGKLFLEDNKNVPAALQLVLSEIEGISDIKAKDVKLQMATLRYSEWIAKMNQKMVLEAKIIEYDNLYKQFIKQCIPDIANFEMELPGIDTKRPEGIYYKGHSVSQMSESEVWELYLLLLQAFKTKVAFIENITSLGSEAIAIINQFAKNGGYVFYSAMNREIKETPKITFHKSIL